MYALALSVCTYMYLFHRFACCIPPQNTVRYLSSPPTRRPTSQPAAAAARLAAAARSAEGREPARPAATRLASGAGYGAGPRRLQFTVTVLYYVLWCMRHAACRVAVCGHGELEAGRQRSIPSCFGRCSGGMDCVDCVGDVVLSKRSRCSWIRAFMSCLLT